MRPLVIRQVVTATKGKGRIKPRRAQLEDGSADAGVGGGVGVNLLANIPRVDGAFYRIFEFGVRGFRVRGQV